MWRVCRILLEMVEHRPAEHVGQEDVEGDRRRPELAGQRERVGAAKRSETPRMPSCRRSGQRSSPASRSRHAAARGLETGGQDRRPARPASILHTSKRCFRPDGLTDQSAAAPVRSDRSAHLDVALRLDLSAGLAACWGLPTAVAADVARCSRAPRSLGSVSSLPRLSDDG